MKITTDENKIEDILTRGTEDIIEKESSKKVAFGKTIKYKIRHRPTGPKIHLGRATILMKLRDFQDLGHNIILIIGTLLL
jgi:tyrosyl-tRNA synthetase